MAYRTKEESAAGQAPTLSPGRKYLFIPEDRQVRVLESTTGKMLLQLPASQATAAAITDDGRRRRGIEPRNVDGLEPHRPERQTANLPNGHDRIVAQCDARLGRRRSVDGGLARRVLSLQPATRTCDLEISAPPGRPRLFEHRTSQIVAGYIVFAQSFSEGMMLTLAGPGGKTILILDKPGRKDELTRKKAAEKPASPRFSPNRVPNSPAKFTLISAAKLPGPKVDETVAAKAGETAASADHELLMILAPGRAVRLEVSAGTDQNRVQAALERKIQANGWKLALRGARAHPGRDSPRPAAAGHMRFRKARRASGGENDHDHAGDIAGQHPREQRIRMGEFHPGQHSVADRVACRRNTPKHRRPLAETERRLLR